MISMIFILTVWWSRRFFKLTISCTLIPEVTGCIQVDSELHVILFYKGCSVSLPQWFRRGQYCRLSRKSMLGNFLLYLESYRILKTFLVYFWRNTETYVHKETCLLSRNCEICITIAIHINSVILNATRTLSIIVIVIIA